MKHVYLLIALLLGSITSGWAQSRVNENTITTAPEGTTKKYSRDADAYFSLLPKF